VGSGTVTEDSGEVFALPTGRATGVVRRYEPHSFSGFPPGVHRGLPSGALTFRFSLDEPTDIISMPDPSQSPGSFFGFVGGLHSRPAMVAHSGWGRGFGVDVSPLVSRQLFGVPAGSLACVVVDLADLMGLQLACELYERLHAAANWPERFGVVDHVLGRVLSSRDEVRLPAEVVEAWRCTVASRGRTTVEKLAAHVGWSRRHLASRFKVEVGLSPKALIRVVRFEHACELLLSAEPRSLAEVAADAGYYDQPHLAREWSDLAGCSPTAWLAEEFHDPPRLDEEFPFVQDRGRLAGGRCLHE